MGRDGKGEGGIGRGRDGRERGGRVRLGYLSNSQSFQLRHCLTAGLWVKSDCSIQ